MRLQALLMALVAGALPAVACTMILPQITVGPNFQVRVGLDGRTIAGLAVQLRGRGLEQQAFSDHNGIAVFRNVTPGSYALSGPVATLGSFAGIDVTSSISSIDTVQMRWPGRTIIPAQRIKGVLHMAGLVAGQAGPSIPFELLDGVTGRTLGRSVTDPFGAFELPAVPAGLYFLRLTGAGFGDGMIAVSVEPSSSDIDLELGSTSCGVWLTDRRSCSQIVLHLTRLAGRVEDAVKAVIDQAEIRVLDAGDQLVQQVQSDSSGAFSIPDLAAGEYRLEVRGAGFTPLRRAITLSPSGESSTLQVSLGVGGSCSDAKAR